MKKKLAVLLTAALTIGALTGCGSSQDASSGSGTSQNSEASEGTSADAGTEDDAGENENQTAADGELETIKIATSSASAVLTESAGIADVQGYFSEELAAVGYQVEYVGFSGAGPAINEAFAAKEIDYAFYAELPILTANSNGVGITAIATANSEYNYGILATEASGITSGADLAGKKVIAPYGTILYKVLKDTCDKYGFDISEVEIINSMTDAATLLASGDADAIITAYSGALMYAGMGLGTVVDSTIDGTGSPAGLVLAGRSEFVSEHPDVDKALIRALYRAYQYAEENPEDVYELLATESSPAEINRAAYAYDTSFAFFNPQFNDSYLENVQSIYEFASTNQLLGVNEVDVDSVFDRSYGDEVAAEFE
jgi:sulfonate transport system substrate-binding protein